MSVKASTWAWQMPLKGAEKLVLLALADHANDEGKCWPKIDSIAEKCGLSRTPVINHLKKFQSLNLIKKETIYNEMGGKKGNIYILNLGISPDSIRKDLICIDSLRKDSIRKDLEEDKSGFRGGISQESLPLYNEEPSMNHQEPSVSMSGHPGQTSTPMASFEKFWTAYPWKEKKKRAREVWKNKKLHRIAEKIIADVEKRKLEHGQWLDGFVPHPTTYLNGERWEDPIDSTRKSQGPPRAVRKTVGEVNDDVVANWVANAGEYTQHG